MIKCMRCDRVSDLSDWKEGMNAKKVCQRCGHSRYLWWFPNIFKNKDRNIKEA